jgi:hypothetical protein
MHTAEIKIWFRKQNVTDASFDVGLGDRGSGSGVQLWRRGGVRIRGTFVLLCMFKVPCTKVKYIRKWSMLFVVRLFGDGEEGRDTDSI